MEELKNDSEKIVKVKIVDEIVLEKENESETGKYLIDVSKIVLAVLVVDNVLTNKFLDGMSMFFIGLGVSFVLYIIGKWLNKRRKR